MKPISFFLSRRKAASVLLAASGTLIALVAPMARAAQPAAQSLQLEINHLSAIARPGLFGITVVDLRDGKRWSVHGAQLFPMMSDFKAPVAAAVLARVDQGRLSLDRKVTLQPAQYVPGSAVPSIGARLAQAPQTVTVAELLQAAVSQSDNTSVDALIHLIGGPQQVTAYLRGKGIAATRVTSGEGENVAIFEHLQGAPKPPAGETVGQRQARLLGGYKAFIAAPPNVTTPDAAALFLEKLSRGGLLSHASTQYLLQLMERQTIPRRLRAGVPPGFRFADKTGTTGTVQGYTGAYNDTGILTAPGGHTVVIAAYLTQSTLRTPDQDALFATLTRDVVGALLTPAAK